MIDRLFPAGFDVVIYQSFEREVANRLEQGRVARLEKTPLPSVADELLLKAGNALIAFGEWIRSRSMAAELVAYGGERYG